MDTTQAKQALQDWFDHAAASTADEHSVAQAVARKQALLEHGALYIDGGGTASAAVPDHAATVRAEALRSWGTRRALD